MLDAKTIAEMDAALNDSPALDVAAMDAAIAEPEKQVNVLDDGARQLATGIVKGIPNLLDAGGAAVATLGDAAMGRGNMAENFQTYLAQQPISKGVDAVLGTQEQAPQTTAGRYMNMTGQGIATAPLAGMKLLSGAMGGFSAAAGGDVGKASGIPNGELIGTVIGGVAGGGAPTAMGPLTSRAKAAFQRSIAPAIDGDTAALAKRAQEFGVDLSLNQVAPSNVRDTVQKVSQVLPFSGVNNFEQAQAANWNKALTKTLGLEGDKLSPEMVKQFNQNIEEGYNKALAGTTVRIRTPQLADLDAIAKEADMSLGKEAADTILKNVKEVKEEFKNGFMRGEKANNIRKSIAARASNGSPELKDWLGQIASKVNEVIADSLPPERADALRGLNRQYRNFKTVEPLLEKSEDGLINPVQLQQRVASSKYIKASKTATGEDELVDLARIGQYLPKLRGSDTFEKQVYGAAANIGGAGVGVGGAVLDPASTAVTLGANRAYQKLYNQNPNVLSKSIELSLPKDYEARKAAFESAKQGKNTIKRKP